MDDQEESPRSASGSGSAGPGAGAPKRGHRTACNSCKRMKVKCEWDQESICNRCAKHQTECVFTIPERKKREKKETYLTTLEDRLNRMEAVMAQSGLSMPTKEPGKEAKTLASEEVGIQDIPDKMSLLKIFDDGTTLFIGASSGFSIFGPQGLKWVTEVTGSTEFAKVIMSLPSPHLHLASMGPEMWGPLPDDQLERLPSKERAMIYITEFFNGFGAIFPLFSQPIFMERFVRLYPLTPSQDPAWYACLNVVFAIGSVILNKQQTRNSPCSSASSPRSSNPEDEVWWKWFRNASSTFLELQFREGNMSAVQAMIGMAFILQTLPNPYPCSVLAGAGLRLAQAIGLHRNVSDVGLTQAQVEERRNVFWSSVIIERAIIMRSGRPSVMQEDDIGIDLPKPAKNAMMGPNVPQPIRYMATLSLLQGRIYNKLYSAKAATRSTLERLQWVSTLDEELQEWKDNLPIEIRPGNEMKVNREFVIPVIMMHYGYLNALSTIHRCSVHYKSWANGGEPPLNMEAMSSMKLNPRVFSSGAITVGAARGVMNLLKETESHVDQSEMNVISVLQNPRDSQALSDVALMRGAVDFLATAMDSDDRSPSTIVIRTFKAVCDLAGRFVEKAQAQGTQNPKRGREPLQTPNYVLDSSPLDYVDKAMTDHPPGMPPPSSDTESSQTFRQSPSAPLPETTSYDSSISQQPPFSIHQTLPNQPGTTQQFLNDPLAPSIGLYNTDLYGNNDLSGLDSGLGAGVDFFPNDLLMPTDGSWFFPLANTAMAPGSS
ncbi:uncharacterized protein LY89DRAFT_57986 [Mollisia scopiformis]|uniref:Zn(2)-C6 fungal-type domain-containing protein n=1 Tax=Mollisia scopiformis TaxID=149040 RepID=A0A194XBQ4_MOLSC|nr:uncharacterized protein LY89DRAFT_57986 [Mollisia scopiformis]KUJ17595.1 hypothetical protein LY89DRAFT_57986 [Mollisia scopiformis]